MPTDRRQRGLFLLLPALERFEGKAVPNDQLERAVGRGRGFRVAVQLENRHVAVLGEVNAALLCQEMRDGARVGLAIGEQLQNFLPQIKANCTVRYGSKTEGFSATAGLSVSETRDNAAS